MDVVVDAVTPQGTSPTRTELSPGVALNFVPVITKTSPDAPKYGKKKRKIRI